MLNTETRDFVVIGAGVVGLSVAAELATRGHDVVCLEQATVGHEWSGSKGESRLFRLGYDDPLYVAMAESALAGWHDLEERAGKQLLFPCELVNFGHTLDELVEGMRAAGAEPELIGPEVVAARYPGLSLPGGAVVDSSSGVLLADEVLAALSATQGAELRQQSAVRTVEDIGRAVRVRTADGAVEASAAIVCAGPATEKLLSAAGIPCRLVPSLEQVAYFSVEPGSMPALAERLDQAIGVIDAVGLYGLPIPNVGRYKMGIHRTGPIADMGRTPLEPDPVQLRRLVSRASELIPGVGEPRLVDRCVYDNTSDGDFVIDRVGRIVVGAGTSGHGFKFGPVFGSVLADLATEAQPAHDLERFSVARPAVGEY